MENQDGTISGFTKSQATLVTGGDDCMQVAATTDNILGHTTDSNDQEVTFEHWCKWSSTIRAVKTLSSAWTVAGNWGYIFGFLSDGRMFGQARRVSGGATTLVEYSVANTDALADGNPHHLVMTHSKSAGLTKLYVDGSLVDTSTEHSPGDTIATGNPMRLGWNPTYGAVANMFMDEFAYYRKVLDASTISSHHTTGTA